MMDGGGAWRIDGWQTYGLTWGRVVRPTCGLAVASIAACLPPEVVTLGGPPGAGPPSTWPGRASALVCRGCNARLKWIWPRSTLRLTLYTSWSFRSCVPVLRPLTVTSQACWAVQVSCKRVVPTCLLTWHLAGPGLDCCYCLHFAGGWKVTVCPPPLISSRLSFPGSARRDVGRLFSLSWRGGSPGFCLNFFLPFT